MTNWRMVLLLAAGYVLIGSASAPAMETTLEVVAGYDDNAAEISDTEGSAMARYLARLRLPVSAESSGVDLDAYLEALYCQYFSLDDNQQVRAGAELSTPWWRSRIGAALFAEAALYRDDLVTEDEHNTLIVGGELQWLADARLTVFFQQTFGKTDYLNRVSLPGQRAYAMRRGSGNGYGGQGQTVETEQTFLSRDDTLWTSEMTATYALSSEIEVALSFLYRSVDSSDAWESYGELGGSSQVTWYSPGFMEVSAYGYWSKRDYDNTPDGDERRDDVYGFALETSRSMGPFELLARFDGAVNDSPVAGEDYRKTVVLCGVSYTF
jgi:hypothetical protein